MDTDKAQLMAFGENLSKLGGSGNTTQGMKYDGGKGLANILFEDFPNALDGIVAIGTYGAKKYARSSWHTVPNGPQRYRDALVRHQLSIGKGELYDPESNLLHAAHFAWNALAILEFLIRNDGHSISRINEISRTTQFPSFIASGDDNGKHF